MKIPLKLLSFLKYKTQEFFSNSTGFFVKFPPLDVPQNLKCDKISIQICNFGETRFIWPLSKPLCAALKTRPTAARIWNSNIWRALGFSTSCVFPEMEGYCNLATHNQMSWNPSTTSEQIVFCDKPVFEVRRSTSFSVALVTRSKTTDYIYINHTDLLITIHDTMNTMNTMIHDEPYIDTVIHKPIIVFFFSLTFW